MDILDKMSQQMSTKTWIISLIQDLVENLPTINGGLNPKPNNVQNVKTMSENIMSVCQHVDMSIWQNATFELRYQKESWSECKHDVNLLRKIHRQPKPDRV